MTEANLQPNTTPTPEPVPDDEKDNEMSQMSLHALVGEYERESERIRLGDDGELIYEGKRKRDGDTEKPKRGQVYTDTDYDPLDAYADSIPMPGENTEKNLSALAFAMPLLMLVLGTLTAGFGVPLMLLVTLIIYMSYKDRSAFVQQNVGEALKGQLIGTLGWLGVIIGLPLIGGLLSVVLALTIVGVLLIPFLWIAIVLGMLASFALPVWMLIFGVVGAWESLQGKAYRYPVPNFVSSGRWRRYAGRGRIRMRF